MSMRRRAALLLAAAVGGAVLATSAGAATTVVVTPANTQGWNTADTRPGGAVNFVADAMSPLPAGALQLTTDSTTAAKAQYMHAANTPLSTVTELSYYTKQVSASFASGDPSYQLVVYLDGTSSSFTTFVYEPYENGLVSPGVWQKWDVASGQFWSSRTVSAGTCNVVKGSGGPPFYTLTQIEAMCPNAVVVGFGVNVGTFNPSYVVETDGVDFNGTIYDFQLTNTPTSTDQCKDGGYVNYTDASGQGFKNQGQCVAYVASNGQSNGNGHGN